MLPADRDGYALAGNGAGTRVVSLMRPMMLPDCGGRASDDESANARSAVVIATARRTAMRCGTKYFTTPLFRSAVTRLLAITHWRLNYPFTHLPNYPML
jgi:hypothetical protein